MSLKHKKWILQPGDVIIPGGPYFYKFVNVYIYLTFYIFKNRIGSNELIGCTAIGSTLIGIGREHWLQMLDNPRKPVAQWYPLNKSPPNNVTLPNNDAQNAGLSCLNGR